jgi:hypothetical protein
MSTSRRQVLRPPRPAVHDPRRERQVRRAREQLEAERAKLDRWMTRLKRAFHTVEKHQRRIAGLERKLRNLEPA